MDNKIGIRVTEIGGDSPLAKLGVRPGSVITSVNNQPAEDIFDLWRVVDDGKTRLTFENPDGSSREVQVAGEPLKNLSFAPMQIRHCRDRCIFCFVDQLPPDMRDTLYFKDEDYRYSFLNQQYVTLSHITERELSRIVDLRLSPLYVSVHSSIPEIRGQMLGGNPGVDIIESIRKLSAGGVKTHAQIVICPGINDGASLDQTLLDLMKFAPTVASAAIVPVGLTRYRDNLFPLDAVDKHCARALIDQLKFHQDEAIRRFGFPWAYLSDEILLLAEETIPPEDFYQSFAQRENGVGMVREFLDEMTEIETFFPSAAESRSGEKNSGLISAGLITGALAWPFVESLCGLIRRNLGIRAEPIKVRNRFFGRSVTVAGLLTGGDIIDLLSERKDAGLPEVLIIPDCMLKTEPDDQTPTGSGRTTGAFLDDRTLSDISEIIGRPVYAVEPTPHAVWEFLEDRM